MLCCVMLCCVMLCYVMLCYVMLCYVVLCYVISSHMNLYHVMTPYIENVILISKVDFIHILHSRKKRKNGKTKTWEQEKPCVGTNKNNKRKLSIQKKAYYAVQL